jgi:hypothetical protein
MHQSLHRTVTPEDAVWPTDLKVRTVAGLSKTFETTTVLHLYTIPTDIKTESDQEVALLF